MMSAQLELLTNDAREALIENPAFLTEQLITYIGNKRSLLNFIGNGLDIVRRKLNKQKIDTFDVFAGSGVVSRFFKQYSSKLYTNDLERYSTLINQCYLTNKSDFNFKEFNEVYTDFIQKIESTELKSGFITEMYAPQNELDIKKNDRVFYTVRNARYIDTARELIRSVPVVYQKYLLAPLLSEASIHANTSGVFKGFYKNADTGIGQFGGKNQDALFRITGNITLPFPVFSNFYCESYIFNGDSNEICERIPEVDVAYLDPPYNQHPYGSNYFMLNVILDYEKPDSFSSVSGIPDDWNRSSYNKSKFAYQALSDLVDKLKAKYLLISFNSEGFVSLEKMKQLLTNHGKLTVLETKYNTFRGSRNLTSRDIHVKEYLYLLEKK